MNDEELVAKWQGSRDVTALNELRQRTARVTSSQVNKYSSSPIPRTVLESKADELMVEAANTYKPGMGAIFRTHLFNNLRRLDRFVKQRANIARIPEGRASKITVFNQAQQQLTDEKKRPPTDMELADFLSWPVTEVVLQRRSVRRDIPSSAISGQHQVDLTDARHQQLLHDIVWELTLDEKTVFEHLFALNGKQRADSGKELSRLTGFSQPKVSILRKRIAKKLEPHL